jgi:hypothetical protein
MINEIVKTKNGLELSMELLTTDSERKLFIDQERFYITNLDNEELESIDVIDYFYLPLSNN